VKKIDFRNDILPLKNILFRLALRITLNKEEAEDVVQETMMKMWNLREEWEKIDSIEAFSLKVCRNLAIDKTKRAARGNISLEEQQEVSGESPDHSYTASPEQQTITNDRIELVRKLVETLPEKQRSIIQLRDFEGKSYREIATVLGISEEQVKVYLHRARNTIKQKYTVTDKYGL